MSNTPSQMANAAQLLSHEEQQAIQDFSELIEARMVNGCEKGFKDWNDPTQLTDQKLRCLLVKALREADWGSVGAYAMMAQQRGLQVVNPMSKLEGLLRSVLGGEEFDRGFLNDWTRQEKPTPPTGTIRTEGFLGDKVRKDMEGRN